MPKPRSLIRPLVRDLHAYVPGEQPKIRGLIKLNTNENPYPPSPKVLKAVKAAVDGRLRLYPPPTAQALREKLDLLHVHFLRRKLHNMALGFVVFKRNVVTNIMSTNEVKVASRNIG